MNQVHGDRVEVVDEPRTEPFEDTDALVTTTPRLALAVVTADCVPVLMGDARAGVVAGVHAGRVGAADGGAADPGGDAGPRRPRRGHLGVARPGRQRGQLRGSRADGRRRGGQLPGSRTTTAAAPRLDLRAGIARQLAGAGVTAIDVDPRCTVADRRLFSHRRDAPTGRLASLVWME